MVGTILIVLEADVESSTVDKFVEDDTQLDLEQRYFGGRIGCGCGHYWWDYDNVYGWFLLFS